MLEDAKRDLNKPELPQARVELHGFGSEGFSNSDPSGLEFGVINADDLTRVLPDDFDELHMKISPIWGLNSLSIDYQNSVLNARYSVDRSDIPFTGPAMIEVYRILEKARAPIAEWEPPSKSFSVFLGHGPDSLWRELKDGLQDGFHIPVRAFEKLPRGGFTISQVLDREAQIATAAVLLLVGSDVMEGGARRGRQNVIHELGYFQGRLGWENAILVVEEGVEIPSNLDGTQQVRFPKGRVREALADVAARLGDMRDLHDGVTTGEGVG